MVTNRPFGSHTAMAPGGVLSIFINLLMDKSLSPGWQKHLMGRDTPKCHFKLGSQAFRPWEEKHPLP